MFRKALTILVFTTATSVFAEEPSDTLLEELEALAVVQATDVLNTSVRDYYEKNSDIAQGKHPTLLHDAAIMGSLKLLKYLVKHDNHDIDFAYEDGPTPLGYIAGDNQIAAAKILLHAGANPNDIGNTDSIFPLSSAVTSGNIKMIQLLLKHDAEVHIGAYYQSPLGLTLEKNDIETLQLFDHSGFKVDSLNDELRIIVTEYLNSDFVEEDVLKILKLHGFDIYAKTAEKVSFFAEYGKKIEHSDVRQMLQDIYETPSTEATPINVEDETVTTSEEQISTEADLTPDIVTVENSEDDTQIDNVIEPELMETQEELSNSNKVIETEVNTADSNTSADTQEILKESATSSEVIEAEPSTTEAIEDLDNKDNMVENVETTNSAIITKNDDKAVSVRTVVDDASKGETLASEPVLTNSDKQNNTDN